MSQQIAVSSGSSGCSGTLIAPPVRTSPAAVTIAAGAGNTATTIYTAATGEKVPLGGKVLKTNACDRLKVEVTYFTGGDCNPCTPDTITTGPVEVYYAEPNGGGVDLEKWGYIAKVDVTVVDSAGAPTTSLLGGDVRFESERAALCNEVLAP